MFDACPLKRLTQIGNMPDEQVVALALGQVHSEKIATSRYTGTGIGSHPLDVAGIRFASSQPTRAEK
jgi:hypothetical protein